MITWLPAGPWARPGVLASPFGQAPPHPLAVEAARQLQHLLGGGRFPELDAPGGGKMFGVLAVAGPDGRLGYLQAFSGMLGGGWVVEGFAPPLFDLAAFEALWPAGQATLRTLELQHRAICAEAEAVGAALGALKAKAAAAAGEQRARHQRNREERQRERAAPGASAAAIDQRARVDSAERRWLKAAQATERAGLEATVAERAQQRRAVEALRAAESRGLMQQVHGLYRVPNARGEVRGLRELFAPGEPAGGAGDCAAPKLFAAAYRLGVRPLALAEFWWGAAPVAGGRRAGQWYPSCRGKCGPLLPFMLEGLEVEAAPVFGAGPIEGDEPRVVFEDPWLVVVDKPCGLLAVPGRHAALRDSALTRLKRQWPGVAVAHRLDLDTSGLLLAAKDGETFVALQRLFARREIEKRYVAWVDGELAADEGVVELALRVDLDDRPRQIHDPSRGKSAVTGWRVLERAAGRTRVALFPRTGRTHQLRVHAAHPLGLGAPIVGDRLYGREGSRLMLHAEALAFTHPRTGQRVELERPAPF